MRKVFQRGERKKCRVCFRWFDMKSYNATVCGDECREEIVKDNTARYREKNQDKNGRKLREEAKLAKAIAKKQKEALKARRLEAMDIEGMEKEWDRCRYITDEEREALISKCKNFL